MIQINLIKYKMNIGTRNQFNCYTFPLKQRNIMFFNDSRKKKLFRTIKGNNLNFNLNLLKQLFRLKFLNKTNYYH